MGKQKTGDDALNEIDIQKATEEAQNMWSKFAKLSKWIVFIICVCVFLLGVVLTDLF